MDTGVSGRTVRRTLEWTAMEGDEGVSFKCETTFPSTLNPPPAATDASNVLEYRDVTEFPVVDVHCE